MIKVVKFKGGLGNQLFQYAAARGIMKPFETLCFNTANYQDDYLNRKFQLEHFNVKGLKDVGRFCQRLSTNPSLIHRVLRKIRLLVEWKELGFKLHRYELTHIPIVVIDGYWQSEFYFKHIRKELLKELTPKVEIDIPSSISNRNSVAVHVRRSDYLVDQRYGFLGLTYYKNAMDLFRKNLSNPVFIFFSDDMEWCKTHFSVFDDVYFMTPNEDWEDLYLISKCAHQIIANSTFSWWGAWLNQGENKIVIRPEQPFRDTSLLYENYYPLDWVSIPNNED